MASNKKTLKSMLLVLSLCYFMALLVVFISKNDFYTLGEIGWLIHASIAMSLFGIGVILFMFSKRK